MLTAQDYTDIGTLLSFALQPTKRPSSDDYKRTLARYRSEVEFRDAMNGVLDGLSVKAVADSDFGLFLGVEPESPFAFRMSDMPSSQKPEQRLLWGLVLLGVAAYAYSTAADLEEERVRYVNETDFEAWLRSRCEQMRSREGVGEVVPEEGMEQAWRIFADMPTVFKADRGTLANRLSPKSTMYWVHHALSWLSDQGMARTDRSAGTGTWALTERFRVMVKEMAAERAYTYLRDLDRLPITPTTDRPTGAPAGAPVVGVAALEEDPE
jgi:hypothetical protein